MSQTAFPPGPESTQDLVQRARDGDRTALERLFARFLPRLKHWASGRLPAFARDLRDTDDMVHEALVQTLKHLNTFQPRHEGAFQAYLYQAVLNRIRSEIRRFRRQPAREGLSDQAADPGPSPLEEAIGRDAFRRYEAALDRLPAADQDAIRLRVELGFDYDTLAEALGKPSRDAARVAVSRALVRLAREMGHGG